MAAEPLLCKTATHQVSPWPEAFSDTQDGIGPKHKQGSDEKEDPFLATFSPLVCFHQYFQFMIQKNSKIGYSSIIQL